MSTHKTWLALLIVVICGSLFLITSNGEGESIKETIGTSIPTFASIKATQQPMNIVPKSTPAPMILDPNPERVNDIGLYLNKIYSTKYENYYFSPESVYTVLNIIGISSVGETRAEIDLFTGINNSSLINQPEEFLFEFAMWYSEDILINNAFILQTGVSATPLSGNNVDEINNWVEETLGYQQNISKRSLFAPESEIAFGFANNFSISEYLPTGDISVSGPFTKMDDSVMRIDYCCTNSSISESISKKYHFFSFQTKDLNKTLLVIQPNNKYDAMNMLSNLKIGDLMSGVGDSYQEKYICFPQGKYFSEIDFTDLLIQYGIRRIFFPDVAELSNLSMSESTYISGVYSFAESDFEMEGNKVSQSSLPEDTYWLDSPFLYFVIDNDNSMLKGIGRLISP